MAEVQGVQENKKKLIIKQRHISPPPKILGMNVQQNGKDSEASMPGLDKTSMFKFPFQRRARSLSLPKDENGNEIVEEEPQKPPEEYESRLKG